MPEIKSRSMGLSYNFFCNTSVLPKLQVFPTESQQVTCEAELWDIFVSSKSDIPVYATTVLYNIGPWYKQNEI